MKYYSIGLLAIGLALSFFTHCFSEETILIATEEYPPHTSRMLKHYGLNCHIVAEAFALEGIKVKYSFYPGKRAYLMAQIGKVDGALPWVRRKEREEYFYFPNPVYRAGLDSFFHLKSFQFNWDPDKPDYKKLQGIAIGAVIGHNYGESFQLAEKSGLIQVQRVPTIQQNFKKLLSGRIQLYIVADVVGYYELQTNFTSEQVGLITHTLENTLPAENYHLILSKKANKGRYFLKAFNCGLRQLKKSGKYDQFVEESKRGDYIIKTNSE